MYLPLDKATLCLQLLVEGNSLRSVERITGVSLHTLLNLLLLAGEKCERLLDEKLKGLTVRDVQADEMWGYVGMKEKTKKRQGHTDATLGDAYTFVAIERHTKLVLAWHLGRRSVRDTVEFTEKINEATTGRFQLTTDGFNAYPDAVAYSLGTRVDFAQLIKVYAQPQQGGGEHRYSPAEVVKAIPTPRWGRPDPERISTSHVERQNLTMRMMMRRLTRLTNAFSKKWENLRAALALHFAYYNFCRIHKTLRCTPAMEAGITGHVWELKDLLA
jgi:IS1 family transposase